jgi:hypothetical protein
MWLHIKDLIKIYNIYLLLPKLLWSRSVKLLLMKKFEFLNFKSQKLFYGIVNEYLSEQLNLFFISPIFSARSPNSTQNIIIYIYIYIYKYIHLFNELEHWNTLLLRENS